MYKLNSDDNFTRITFNKYKIPRQGWKIHISSSLKNYNDVITIVKQYCYNHQITFKYFSNETLYQENVSINYNPAESGKLITIYPCNSEMAYNIMSALSRLLHKYSGPYVLSDYRFQNSKNVFFRYGINIYTSKNKLYLISPKGEKEIDRAYYYPHTPHWLSVPMDWIFENTEQKHLISLFHPSTIIKRSNGGNIYRGIDNNNCPVIIKEARQGIVLDNKLSIIDLRDNEWYLAIKLNNHSFPSPIKKIKTTFANYYVYKQIHGETLTDYIASKGFLVCNKDRRKEAFNNQKVILLKILNIIRFLKRNNLSNLDIHSDNFIVDDNLNVTLIDLESINIPNYLIKTLGFWKDGMEKLPFESQDLCKFILLSLFTFGECSHFINILNKNEFLNIVNNVLKSYGNIYGINNLIQDLYDNENPDKLLKKITEDLNNIQYLSANSTRLTENIKIISPKISTQQTLKLIYSGKSLNKNSSIGLNGLGGILISNIYKNNCKGILQNLKYLSNLKVRGIDAWYMSSKLKVINPYVNNGLAGILLAISMLPANQWPKETVKVAKYLSSFEFAKNFGYNAGYLGITDAILTIAYISKEKRLFQKGIINLKKLKCVEIKRNNKNYFPFWDKKKTYLSENKLNGTKGYELILKKWGLYNADN